MSREFMKWSHGLGIRVKVIARGAHHTSGMLERNHQVRREHIALHHEAHPDDSLKKALVVPCSQRNRLRNVSGFTPLQRVFGATPTGPRGVVGESARQSDLRDNWPHGDAGSFYAQRSLSAASAFFAANASRAVKAALAALCRPLRRQFSISDWIYYWKQEITESGLAKSFWKGPAMMVTIEYGDATDKLRHSIICCVHCTVFIRVTYEMMCQICQESEEHSTPLSHANAVLAQLRHARGPIPFSELVEQERPSEEESVIEDVDMPATGTECAQPAYSDESVPALDEEDGAAKMLEPLSAPAILGPSTSEAGRKAAKMSTVRKKMVKVEARAKEAAECLMMKVPNEQTSRRRKSLGPSQILRGRMSKSPWLWMRRLLEECQPRRWP